MQDTDWLAQKQSSVLNNAKTGKFKNENVSCWNKSRRKPHVDDITVFISM